MKGFLSALFLLLPTAAFAIDPYVRQACKADYFAYCADTSPGSEECKRCFKRVGKNLSENCKFALKRSKEYSSEYATEYKRYHPGQ